VVLIAILALTFYLRLLYFGQYIDGDVGNAGYQAWRMAEGEVVIDLEGPGKPPFYPMLYALFIRFFGPSVLGLKMFGAILVLLAVVAVYWLANQAYGKKVGLLAALLFGVFSSGPMIDGGTVNLETVMHLPYILAIGLFLRASVSGELRWYFLAGLSAALATLVKQVSGVLFFVFLCCWINEWWKKKNSFPRTKYLYRYVMLGTGALLPVIALITFYRFHGYTINQLYDSMLGSNFRYIQRGYEYRSLLEFFSSAIKVMLPENGLLWFGTVFAAAYIGRRIWRGEGEARDRILLWWVFWSFAMLWISGTFFYHYFLQMIGPFSVLAAYGIVASWKWAKSLSPSSRFVAQGGWTILLVIMVVIFIKTDYKYFFIYTAAEQTVFQLKISNGLFDQYGLSNLVNREIAFYIRDHTDPSEAIYVWGIAPQIYFLAQRRAATRYRNNFNMSILVTNDARKALQAYAPMVMEDIRKSRPAYIVQIFRLEDFPELQTFVRDGYMLDRSMELPVPPNKIHLFRRGLDNQSVQNPR
jgi:4-amino-4-deoxy-L-arabinose transferase-like glycosyltransferase